MLMIIAGTMIMNGQVTLFTDRNLYVTGEMIYFSASIHCKDIQAENTSRILYCELITPDGIKIAGGKYLIQSSSSLGSLVIPDDILTGNYYLRAYSKHMRNGGPGSYSYNLIKIVNANRNEVQSSASDGSKANIDYENEFIQDTDIFRIITGKTQYSRPDIIDILIHAAGSSSVKNLSISVVPEHSLPSRRMKTEPFRYQWSKILYHKENLGLSLTGKLTGNITGIAIKDTRINLSIIGEGRDFMATKTDSAGGFYFSLPDYTGSRDLFICAEKTGNAEHLILVDNDYCTLPVQIASEPFKLNDRERETALKMAVNLEVGSYFSKDSIYQEKVPAAGQAFYGKPTEILYIDKYIQLPTLEEYFNALAATVKIRKRQGEKYVRILGRQSELTEFDPLIMVDLVAVEDLAGILALNPQNISRIEIVNALYVRGDQTYGGIVNIISVNNDFAGINLPSSGIFIDYGFLSPSGGKKSPLPGAPDTRNTLYWDPHLTFDENGKAEISFPAPDTPGRYIVVLNGINSSGEIFRQTAGFEVATGQD